MKFKTFHNKNPHKSLNPESNQGSTDYLDTLQVRVHFKSFCNKTPHNSLDPESNQGPTDYLNALQSAALPTELSREE
jgi:hypothetical protein